MGSSSRVPGICAPRLRGGAALAIGVLAAAATLSAAAATGASASSDLGLFWWTPLLDRAQESPESNEGTCATVAQEDGEDIDRAAQAQLTVLLTWERTETLANRLGWTEPVAICEADADGLKTVFQTPRDALAPQEGLNGAYFQHACNVKLPSRSSNVVLRCVVGVRNQDDHTKYVDVCHSLLENQALGTMAVAPVDEKFKANIILECDERVTDEDTPRLEVGMSLAQMAGLESWDACVEPFAQQGVPGRHHMLNIDFMLPADHYVICRTKAQDTTAEFQSTMAVAENPDNEESLAFGRVTCAVPGDWMGETTINCEVRGNETESRVCSFAHSFPKVTRGQQPLRVQRAEGAAHKDVVETDCYIPHKDHLRREGTTKLKVGLISQRVFPQLALRLLGASAPVGLSIVALVCGCIWLTAASRKAQARLSIRLGLPTGAEQSNFVES